MYSMKAGKVRSGGVLLGLFGGYLFGETVTTILFSNAPAWFTDKWIRQLIL